jgi:tripeptide aminopeptidase
MLPDAAPEATPASDNRISQLAADSQVTAALAAIQKYAAQAVDLAVKIQQIPAPTFAEAERAAFVQAQFEAIGLQNVSRDELDNVYGRFPAPHPPTQPPLIISAHTDTVFAAHTDLTLRHDGRLLYGPGIADNAMGVAGILFLAQILTQFHFQPQADIWFVANVGEEGLGDLCGMKAVCQRFGTEARYIVVEGGLFGQISHQSIGVRRFRIEVETEGGHSWGSFGKPSAIHRLGHLIAAIDRLDVPARPKTTYNVGVIEGGRSINTIASSASLLLDLRSEDPTALDQLVEQVTGLVRAHVVPAGRSQPAVAIKMELIGSRPAGQTTRQAPLVGWAAAALQQVGWEKPLFITSSTDANIPLSLGAEAICLGLTESGNAHRLDEYLDPTWLPQGLSQLLLVTLAAVSPESLP